MFRDDIQKARVCRILNQDVPGELWANTGPTSATISIVEKNGAGLSAGQRILVLLAFNIWTGEASDISFTDFFRLDSNTIKMIGSLLIAKADGANEVDRWIEAWTS